MYDWPSIVAQESGGEWIKFVFGAIVVGIWIISALASAVAKKHEKERRQRVREQIEMQQSQPMPPPRMPPRAPATPRAQRMPPAQRIPPSQRVPSTARRQPPPIPRQPARPVQRTAAPKQRRITSPPSAPFAGTTRLQAQPLAPATQPVAQTEISTVATIRKRPPATATASAVARWLNPHTLRQQFILTEILQPPLALRPPRD
jgi:hypothetical protein